MKKYETITPEGTKDYLYGELDSRKSIEQRLQNIFISYGYKEIVSPEIEFYDVFNLSSRYFPQESMYKLIDNKGRILVLRPDSTIPIARIVATRLKNFKLPIRLYYNQNIYCTNASLAGKSNEIKQMGIELIGSNTKKSDKEIIFTAIDVLKSCDKNFRLEIGDIGLFKLLVDKLDTNDENKENIRKLIEVKNYPALSALLDSIGNNEVTKGLRELPRLFGGKEVFEKAGELFKDFNATEIYDNLKDVYRSIDEYGYIDNLIIDLGIVNRTDYYTGIVMKGYIQGCGEEVLSGGRYDKLIAEFGYNIPATGFGININTLMQQEKKNEHKKEKEYGSIVFCNIENVTECIKYCNKLREEGKATEFSTFDTLEETKNYANQKNLKVIEFGGKENE